MSLIRKNINGIRFIFLTTLIIGFTVSYVLAKDTCVDCHSDEKFRVQYLKLYVYYNNWKDSIHDMEGVKCFNCHGGNPDKTDKDASHKDHFSSLRANDKESLKAIPLRCGKCHKEIFKSFTASKHYKALTDKVTCPNCVTCHDSMNTQVYRSTNIAEGCGACHNEKTKNKPEVVKTAESILHDINISTAYKGWVLTSFYDKKSREAEELNKRLKDIATSWHKFDFTGIGKKTAALLNDLKSTVKRGLAGRGTKKTDK